MDFNFDFAGFDFVTLETRYNVLDDVIAWNYVTLDAAERDAIFAEQDAINAELDARERAGTYSAPIVQKSHAE